MYIYLLVQVEKLITELLVRFEEKLTLLPCLESMSVTAVSLINNCESRFLVSWVLHYSCFLLHTVAFLER